MHVLCGLVNMDGQDTQDLDEPNPVYRVYRCLATRKVDVVTAVATHKCLWRRWWRGGAVLTPIREATKRRGGIGCREQGWLRSWRMFGDDFTLLPRCCGIFEARQQG